MSVHWTQPGQDALNPPRIAYFSPLPPERSGIADYSRELLPYLAQHAELILYSADPEQVDEELRAHFPIRHLDRFPQERWEFDMPLYQMGNSEHHTSFYPLLLHYPGLVVLHDYAIRHFIAYRTLEQGDFTGYARELGYALGAPAMQRAHAIRLHQAPPAVFEAALNDRLLDSSLGLIVHSAYVADNIQRHGFNRPLTVIPHLIEEPRVSSRRDELNIPEDMVLFASFGVITRPKQIEMALNAFKKLRATLSKTHYLLVGEAAEEIDLARTIAELDLAGDVTHIGYVSDFSHFVDWMHTADIVINLREPTMGETSGTALRSMSAGRPLIVFDHGWYSELPGEAALKTPVLDEEKLLEAMMRLAQSSQLRKQMGEAGRRYTLEVCHPRVVAEAYIQALFLTLEGALKPNE